MKAQSSNLIKRSFTLAFNNMLRNKLLSLATIFVIGTIIFIFNVILGINGTAENSLENISKKIDYVIYLKESTSQDQALELAQALEPLEGIEKISYTSKEEAITQIKEAHPEMAIAFEKYQLGNPLPASLNIKTSHPKHHQAITAILEQDQFKKLINTSSKDNESILQSVSDNLYKLTNFTKQIIFWLISTFVIGGALIIINALQITIFSRKKEIEIMKLVGAPHWFIRAPFIIESIVYSALAVILSFIMLLFLSSSISIGSTLDFRNIFIAEIAVTMAVGIISSALAIHEYLQREVS